MSYWDYTWGTIEWENKDSLTGFRSPRDSKDFLADVLNLLAHGADPNCKFNGSSILLECLVGEGRSLRSCLSEESKLGLTCALIAAGADVRYNHIFWNAAFNNCGATIGKLFIAAGANVNDKSGDSTVLSEACCFHDVEFAELLIEAGANLKRRYCDGENTLDGLRENAGTLRWDYANGTSKHAVEIEELRRYLASLRNDIRDGLTNDTLTNLLAFAKTGRNCDLQLVDWQKVSDNDMKTRILDCKKAGIDLNKQNPYGNTHLHQAAAYGYIETVKALISNGANVNIQDKGGQTALHWCAGNGHIEVADELIKHGADVLVRNNNGEYPSLCAGTHGHTKLCFHLSEIENAEAFKNLVPESKEESKQEPQTIKHSDDWEKSWGKMEKMIEKYHD